MQAIRMAHAMPHAISAFLSNISISKRRAAHPQRSQGTAYKCLCLMDRFAPSLTPYLGVRTACNQIQRYWSSVNMNRTHADEPRIRGLLG